MDTSRLLTSCEVKMVDIKDNALCGEVLVVRCDLRFSGQVNCRDPRYGYASSPTRLIGKDRTYNIGHVESYMTLNWVFVTAGNFGHAHTTRKRNQDR